MAQKRSLKRDSVHFLSEAVSLCSSNNLTSTQKKTFLNSFGKYRQAAKFKGKIVSTIAVIPISSFKIKLKRVRNCY